MRAPNGRLEAIRDRHGLLVRLAAAAGAGALAGGGRHVVTHVHIWYESLCGFGTCSQQCPGPNQDGFVSRAGREHSASAFFSAGVLGFGI